MALSRRSNSRLQSAIWPGFVDAMTGLLLVLMFVLTIFMVVQFVLRETISGQENELDSLSSEVAALAQALGLEQNRRATLEGEVDDLSSTLDAASREAEQQARLIDSLRAERAEQDAALGEAQNRISDTESRIAALILERDAGLEALAGLEDERDTLVTQLAEGEAETARLSDAQAALELALATARDEIDAEAEAARLAAARTDALNALIEDLRRDAVSDDEALQSAQTQIDDLEAERLADAAAAQALRDRLANADAEITAMTLSLEAERAEAEETLTLLAAANAAREDLDARLAATLLAQETSEADLETARAALEEALTTADNERRDAQAQLAAALLARQDTEAQLAAAQDRLAEVRDTTGSLRDELDAAHAARLEAQRDAETEASEAERARALLAIANETLSQEEALSAESRREAEALNRNVAALRTQVAELQSLLGLAEAEDIAAEVEITNLTQRLNNALARAAQEERRRAEAEEQRRILAEREVESLARYQSGFLRALREVLGDQEGIRIEGDRFVFSSEVLFEQGSADLSQSGREEIAKVADILSRVVDDIPQNVDWIIRVDGHTDDIPLISTGRYRNNWELSQGRALSVVRYMSDVLGVPPERLAANGFGEYQPVNTADTEEAHAQNRRIELKLTER